MAEKYHDHNRTILNHCVSREDFCRHIILLRQLIKASSFISSEDKNPRLVCNKRHFLPCPRILQEKSYCMKIAIA